MASERLKEAMERIFHICDQIDENASLGERLGLDEGITISLVLKMNFMFFLAYLSASDGVISWKETRYIGEILDANLTPATIDEMIRDHNIYSTRFEEEVPLTLKLFVALDNAMYQDGADTQGLELGQLLYDIYMNLSFGLFEANGRTAETLEENELADAQTYLGMMRNYIEENTEKHHTDIILDYDKSIMRKRNDERSGGVTAPRKNRKPGGSVRAPQKRA